MGGLYVLVVFIEENRIVYISFRCSSKKYNNSPGLKLTQNHENFTRVFSEVWLQLNA